jgi:hypothetical protein
MRVRRVLGEASEAATVGVVRLALGLRLRVAIAGGMVIAVLASFAAAGAPPWVVPALLIGGSVMTAVRPDTHLGLATLLGFGWYWLVHVDAGATAWSMPAAGGLLLFHLATSALALGPAELELPRSLLLAWARRGVAILAGTAALWLVGALLRRVDAGSNALLTAIALVVVAASGALALLRSSSDAPSSGSSP